MAYIDVRSTIPAGNYGELRSMDIVGTIVFHHIVGDAEQAIARFQKQGEQASSTYVIGSDGSIYYVVSKNRIPYTNGSYEWNKRSITIEHAGGTVSVPYTEAMYRASERLVRNLREQFGIQRFMRHRDISPTACPGGLDVERIVRNSKPREVGDMVTKFEVQVAHDWCFGVPADVNDFKRYVGKMTFQQMVEHMQNSDTFKAKIKQSASGKLDASKHLPYKLQQVYKG